MEAKEHTTVRRQRLVPLRNRNYKRLASVLQAAQKQKRTLSQVIKDLADKAPSDPASALLLRDIWEVARVTKGRLTQDRPPMEIPFRKVADGLLRQPFGGEEVLF